LILVVRNSPEENWSIKPSIHGIFPMRFLGRTGGTEVANKEREEQGRMNAATKEGQRGRKNLKKIRVGRVTSRKPMRYLIEYSRIDGIT